MNPQSLPLHDIHLPAPVGWWPPAPGWWALAVLVPALLWLLVWLVRRRRRPTPEKLALLELRLLELDAELPVQDKLRRLGTLLRRVAIRLYPRAEVAALTGEAWLEWLDRPFGTPRFRAAPGRILVEAAYRRQAEADVDALIGLCREWVRRVGKEQARGRRIGRILPAFRRPQRNLP